MAEMNKEYQRAVTQRMLVAYEHLLRYGKVSSKKDFCERIGLQKQNYYSCEKGRQYCTIANAYLMGEVFNISLDWLFYERGDVFK